MNSNFLKKLLAVAVTSLFLVSVGVSAQEAPTPAPTKSCKKDKDCGQGMRCTSKGKCVTK
jgi:hypothetical protein